MSTTYNGDPDVFPAGALIPDDGDNADAESVNAAFRSAHDRTAWLKKHLAKSRIVPLANLSYAYAYPLEDYFDPINIWFAICYVPNGDPNLYGFFLAVGNRTSDGNSIFSRDYDGTGFGTNAGNAADGWFFAVAAKSGDTGEIIVIVGSDLSGGGTIYTTDKNVSPITSRTPANGPSAPPDVPFRGVAWNGTAWVVCGDYHATGSAQLQSSTNATAWTYRTPGSSFVGDFFAIAANPTSGRFAVVGEAGEIQTSDDNGATWTRRHTVTGGPHLRCVTWVTATVCVAMGDLNPPSGVVDAGKYYRSTDAGATWTAIDMLADLDGFPGTTDTGTTVRALVLVAGVLTAIISHCAGGDAAYMIQSVDAGLTFGYWSRIPNGETGDATQIYCGGTDGQRAVFGAGVGQLLCTQRVPFRNDDL